MKGVRRVKRVELIDLSKSYDKQVNVISNINVTIEPGELLCTCRTIRMWKKYNASDDCGFGRDYGWDANDRGQRSESFAAR